MSGAVSPILASHNAMLYSSLQRHLGAARRVPYMEHNGGATEMFELKQLYVGGAVLALAEVVTIVVLAATR